MGCGVQQNLCACLCLCWCVGYFAFLFQLWYHHGGRAQLAKSAAREVLKTLREVDYATIVSFSTGAESATVSMVPMTAANKQTLK